MRRVAKIHRKPTEAQCAQPGDATRRENAPTRRPAETQCAEPRWSTPLDPGEEGRRLGSRRASPSQGPISAGNPGNLVPSQALVDAVGHIGVEPTVPSKRGVLAQRGRTRAHPNLCGKSREPGTETGPGECSGPSWRRANGLKQEGSAGTARPVPSASQPLRENSGDLVPSQALVDAVGHLGVEPTFPSKRGVLAQRGRSRAHPNPCGKSREPSTEPGPGGCSGPSWRQASGPKRGVLAQQG